MSLRFLLDTNVLSEPLRPQPNQAVMERLQRYEGEIAIATIVWHELLFGCYRLPLSKKRQIIEQYLTDIIQPHMPQLTYDADAARWHAQERARLASLGKTPAFVDSQIAAISKVNGLTLVTNNRVDYADFDGLQLENWFL